MTYQRTLTNTAKARHAPGAVGGVWARAAAAWVMLVVLVLGVPVLLGITIGNPLGSWDDLLAGDASDTVVIDTVAAMAYLAWAWFILTVLVEALTTLIHAPLPRDIAVALPGRALARSLLAAAFLLPPSPAGIAAATASAATQPETVHHHERWLAAHDMATPAAATPQMAVETSRSTDSPGRDATADGADICFAGVTDSPPTSGDAGDPSSAGGPSYTVSRHGPITLWDIAETYLGSGDRWPQIWQLNQGRTQSDGTVMTDPGLLRYDWIIQLPADAHRPPDRHVTVQPGDTLSGLALTHHTTAHDLLRANQDRPQPAGRSLTDPDHIEPGWTLLIPSPALTPAHPRHGQQPSPDPDPPNSYEPRPTNPTPTPTPTAGSAGPSATPTIRPSTAPEPGDADRNHGGDDGKRHTDTSQRRDDSHSSTTRGVEFPGGWVGLPFAAALAAAAAMVWRRRRRRYVPGPLTPEGLAAELAGDETDPDLQALPSVTGIAARAAQTEYEAAGEAGSPDHQLPHGRPQPTDDPSVADPTVADGTVTDLTVAEYAASSYAHRLPVGPDGIDLAGLAHRVTDTGLGLTGPGAHAAARALLVAALSAGSLDHPDARTSIIIPADTLTTLLGANAVDVPALDRLTVTANLSEALTTVDRILLQRRRELDENADLDTPNDPTDEDLIDDDPAADDRIGDDVRGHQTQDPYPPLLPPVLLITERPPATQRARLTTVLQLGVTLRISAVVLGPWSPGDTLDIDHDGQPINPTGTPTAAPAGGRVAVLDIQTTTDLLRILHDAEHTPDEHAATPRETNPRRTDHTNRGDHSNYGDHADMSGADGRADAAEGSSGSAAVESPAPAAGGAGEPPVPPTVIPAARRQAPSGEPSPDRQPTARDIGAVSEGNENATAPARDADAGGGLAPTDAPDQALVRIRVLGPAAVLTPDGNPVPGLRHHARQLMVYLVVHRAGADLSEIMEVLWPDATVRRAQERLSTEVANLRRTIRIAASPATPDGSVDEAAAGPVPGLQPVINTGGHYHLNPQVVTVDAWRLEDALRAATGPDPATRFAALHAAVETHTGVLAETSDYAWIEPDRERFRRNGIRAASTWPPSTNLPTPTRPQSSSKPPPTSTRPTKTSHAEPSEP